MGIHLFRGADIGMTVSALRAMVELEIKCFGRHDNGLALAAVFICTALWFP
ncbi:MAG: hypothetical protein U9N81_04255 [Bacillota bacterium]|nr:hypothetical protein [Bacillota bacterium]MEA1960493.1 hypothetical protein [Bacillota bacterium]